MFARLTVAEVLMGKLDEALKLYEDSVIPAAKSQKGYRGAYLLSDDKTGKVIAITLWDSEADTAAQEWVTEDRGYYKEQLAKFRDYFVGTPIREGYDVKVQSIV